LSCDYGLAVKILYGRGGCSSKKITEEERNMLVDM
jgi:hypothetical protein